jgi:DNA helicase-2/ATP-dependent DNA helicase PcrA
MDNNEMEEERRLCYVAVTRAKEKLYFIYTNTRNIYGSRQTSIKSRFIDEIDSKFFKEGESDSIGNGYGGSGFLGDDFDDKFFDEKENGTGRRASKAWPLEQNDSGAKGQAFSERLAEGNKINMWDFGKTKKEKEDKFLEGENTKKKNNFNDGQKVKHEIFGEGIVIFSDDEMITVVFEGIGVKKLAKKIVQLKKV